MKALGVTIWAEWLPARRAREARPHDGVRQVDASNPLARKTVSVKALIWLRITSGWPRSARAARTSNQPNDGWIKATSSIVDATSLLECRRPVLRGTLTPRDRGPTAFRTFQCGAAFGSEAQAGWPGREAPGSRPRLARVKCDPYASLDRRDPCADGFCGWARARERKRIFHRWIQ